MSPALLHALARPLSLSVRGLHRATQLALRHTTTTRRKCLHNRTALCEARAVRCCSAPEEDEIEKHLMAPDSLSKAHQTDLSSLATSEEFLLPSQQRRKESNLLVVKIKECESVAAAFEVYERHNDVMETKHCLALLEKLGVLAKNSEDSSAQTQQSEGFSALCDQLYSQCRRMEVDDWLNLLKYLCLLRVPATSKLCQVALQEYYKKPLLQVAVELLSVEYYHPQLMQILTSPDTLSLFMSKYHKENINHSRLVDVDQALGRLVSSPHRVPETFLEPGRRLRASQQPTRSFLKAMLHQILPDPSYLMSGLLSGGGIFIAQTKMADVDKWIEVAKECKYLPENDLKVRNNE
ncbi:hypothetical protein E2C01_020125 [Portunus trituberculatus]|uniref:Uncharacterized protein n=1 Tax=Portunus trituberculatus TaxID=210409 RepID=A0A5B7DZ00_PORTR|nr:hypothetical protein [Portunus trituberculatus]